jgi:hypothetical protein
MKLLTFLIPLSLLCFQANPARSATLITDRNSFTGTDAIDYSAQFGMVNTPIASERLNGRTNEGIGFRLATEGRDSAILLNSYNNLTGTILSAEDGSFGILTFRFNSPLKSFGTDIAFQFPNRTSTISISAFANGGFPRVANFEVNSQNIPGTTDFIGISSSEAFDIVQINNSETYAIVNTKLGINEISPVATAVPEPADYVGTILFAVAAVKIRQRVKNRLKINATQGLIQNPTD